MDGCTSTVATGAAVTVMAAVLVLPSTVAVIVALPAETPVTTPLGDTEAMDPLFVVQMTWRLVTTLPFTSVTRAVSVVV